MPEQVRRNGVITYSSGNHGQAGAYAAQLVGVRAVVVMPETAPAVKVAGVKRWGGEVVLAGRTSEDRQRAAEQIAARERLAVVPPFDHPDIVAGQATVGLEIAEALPHARTVVVPVGGGGLIAGVVTGLAAGGSRATVWGDRKSTRLNSSHGYISYAVFCLKKKKTGEEGRATVSP